jgi:hypothetical protein
MSYLRRRAVDIVQDIAVGSVATSGHLYYVLVKDIGFRMVTIAPSHPTPQAKTPAMIVLSWTHTIT